MTEWVSNGAINKLSRLPAHHRSSKSHFHINFIKMSAIRERSPSNMPPMVVAHTKAKHQIWGRPLTNVPNLISSKRSVKRALFDYQQVIMLINYSMVATYLPLWQQCRSHSSTKSAVFPAAQIHRRWTLWFYCFASLWWMEKRTQMNG